ncbi:MAG: phospho-N-acetylmuramoyl-pentapeptide-transferase [Bacteriovoracaceae bacterium]|nr:phospho-N-acetylmuramoyl-pentapeptide-transferase [Bacteriovoracaceae bacterium]
MLYHLLYPLSGDIAFFNIFRYITVRSFAGFILGFFIAIFWGKRFIAYMKERQFGQSIRELGPESHKKKQGTPTMGGVFIIGSIMLSSLIVGNFNSMPYLLCLIVLVSYFFLGAADDYLKILKKNSAGVSARGKLLWQFLTAGIVGYLMLAYEVTDSELYLPFLKAPLFNLGWLYIAFAAVVIVGSSNAVNLTDGLDGLATGSIAISASTLGLLAYVAGHYEISSYLYVPFVDSTGELVVLVSCIVGSCIGFLWYNSNPAEVFMGDCGSLSLGGALGTIAVMTKNEFLFVLIGGIFVMEAVSVILQVASFKMTKKRIFKMAPIHHHFELKGWPEPKVIARFWIIGMILSILAIATLKLR